MYAPILVMLWWALQCIRNVSGCYPTHRSGLSTVLCVWRGNSRPILVGCFSVRGYHQPGRQRRGTPPHIQRIVRVAAGPGQRMVRSGGVPGQTPPPRECLHLFAVYIEPAPPSPGGAFLCVPRCGAENRRHDGPGNRGFVGPGRH
jgi:hypothetical protein